MPANMDLHNEQLARAIVVSRERAKTAAFLADLGKREFDERAAMVISLTEDGSITKYVANALLGEIRRTHFELLKAFWNGAMKGTDGELVNEVCILIRSHIKEARKSKSLSAEQITQLLEMITDPGYDDMQANRT